MKITGTESLDDKHMVLQNTRLTDSTCILRFDRKNIKFLTGQHLGVGPVDGVRTREYSVFSGENEDFIEILVKEVSGGMVSPVLTHLQPGDYVVVDDPVGSFGITKNESRLKKYVFVATGTGIAPFHSFVKSIHPINYTLIHGVRSSEENYGHETFNKDRIVLCVSRKGSGNFEGRVTDYLRAKPQGADCEYYLCGNSNMIHEIHEILEKQGVHEDNIHSEVYF